MPSSVDGDSGYAQSDLESVDGDEGGQASAQPRAGRRGNRQEGANAVREFRKTGSMMIFLIVASRFGLWASDLEPLDLHSWTDLVYGRADRQASLIGAVVGTWEFCSGESLEADTDENIFVDLAKLHGAGKHGMLVYKAVQSIILDSAATACEYPTTTFKLLQKFSNFMCKMYSADTTATIAASRPLKDYISSFRGEHGISSANIVIARFCPKAAWMAVHGWKVFHAVSVSKKFHGTATLGTGGNSW